MDLLFVLAHWHALAKLRQHTDLSLDVLESVTDHLSKILKEFQATTCAAYDTRELKREKTARTRKAEKKSSSNEPIVNINTASLAPVVEDSSTASGLSQLQEVAPQPKKTTGRLRKTLNLKTYKDHALGDYVESIRQNGTVDSYSTELVNRLPILGLGYCMY